MGVKTKEMKRIHLYRGKRLDNGQFIEGSLIGEDVIVGKIVDFEEDYFTTDFWYKVDTATVGQFTGFTDKNELKIFDGDILETEEGLIWVVSWSEKGEWIACDVLDEDTELLSDIVCDNIRVVGNRFDNKELLK